MEYYYFREDKYNNIHSIDNVIITYFLTCTLDFALGHIKMISDCSSNYWISIHAPTRGATAILHKKFVYFYTIPTINI